MATHCIHTRTHARERRVRGAPREVPTKFVLSTLLTLSLSLSHAQSSQRLLQILSVPVAQLVKACVAELKVVGSIPMKVKSFLLLSFLLLSFLIFDDYA